MKKRLMCLFLILLLLMGSFPVYSVPLQKDYYSDSQLSNIHNNIISNSSASNYVNNMMKYYLNNYSRLKESNLDVGKSVVFLFDGCSDNVFSSGFDYTSNHMSAYCAVVKLVNGVPTIVHESENASTIPDNPRYVANNTAGNDGTDVPTVIDGIHNISKVNHGKNPYAALHVYDSSGVNVIRCNSSTYYSSTSYGINVHARSWNYVSRSTYSSTGCINIGTASSWSEYNDFMYAVTGISSAKSSTFTSTGADVGVVVIDRYMYRNTLSSIYENSTLVDTIAQFSIDAAARANFSEPSCNCSTSYAGNYICTTQNYPLTIRSGHGTSYSAIGEIPIGATVYVSKANGSWAHVSYNGVEGLASMEYLQKTTPSNPTNVTISVNKTKFVIGETATFTFNGNNTTGYTIGIDLNGNRVYTGSTGGTSIQYTFTESGSYSAYVTGYNDSGIMDSGRVYFDVYANLGDSFYAVILNKSIWKPIINNPDTDNVELSKEVGCAKELWMFIRDSDGSYMIKSAYNGKCLEVAGASSDIQANVRVYEDNGTNAQRWYIMNAENGGYYFKPKCSECVMDLSNSNSADGTNIQMYSLNRTSAQVFSIYMGSECHLSKPSFSVKAGTNLSSTVFSWSNVPGEVNYRIRICKGTYDNNNVWKYYDNELNITSSSIQLPAGYYEATIESRNWFNGYYSNVVKFTVEDFSSPTVKYYNGHIYEFIDNELTFEEAEQYCEEYRGGHLATITSQEEQDFIQNNLVNKNLNGYMIGGTDKDKEGIWQWVTGEPFEYSNWNEREPNNDSGGSPGGECFLEIYTSNGKWNDFYYNGLKRGFICEIETENYEPIKSITYNGHIYELYNYSISYGEAENYCRWNGGHLVSITSAEEQAKVFSLLSNTDCNSFCWMGATCINRGENWTNGNDNWKWEDGSVFGYTNWETDQPDYCGGIETCLMMYKSNGLWNDVNWDYPCKNKNSFCFILEKEIPSPVLQSIEITSSPDKTEYNVGEAFDPTGLTLKLTYSDGSTETITNGFTISGFDSSTVGTKTITVTYSGFTTTFEVTVVEQKLTGDVDGDGEVSDWDAILLNRYLAGWKNVTLDLSVADIDGDGEVSDWDAIILERYLAGWKIEINN